MTLKSLLPVVFLFCVASLCAQKKSATFEPQRWGDFPTADLAMTIYPKDSNATALVLQDIGELQLYARKRKAVVQLNRRRRIKVFDVSAFNQGNLRIFYRANKEEEKMTDLDIQVVSPSGRVEKVKSDNVFTETVTDKWLAKKIFIPNLQKGSIIEYRYELRSADVFSLYEWYFQEEIPIRWSELTVSTPSDVKYVHVIRTPETMEVKDSTYDKLVWHEAEQLNYNFTKYTLADIPAFKPEPYTAAPDDYRAQIQFQIKRISTAFLIDGNILTDWDGLTLFLTQNSIFGRFYLDSLASNQLEKAFRPLLSPGDSGTVIAEKALRFISKNIKWDESFSLFPASTPNEVFKQKAGSSAQVNMSLTALLRRVGVKSYPVLVSTRSNGLVVQEFPVLKQFNSVLAYVPTDSLNGILLDATSPYHSLNELQPEHCNGVGRIVRIKGTKWVPLVARELSETWYGNLQMNEDGDLSGNFSLSAAGALAADWRTTLEHEKEVDFLKKTFSAQLADIQFDSIKINRVQELDKPIVAQFKCRITGAANAVNDYIYFKPILDFVFLENPFKSASRAYPVNFPCPTKGNYVLSLQLPPGYHVEELPADATISLPENAGKLSFSCTRHGENSLQIIFKMQLQKLNFGPDEYVGLQQFFHLATDKIQSQIVLKKL
ncbi:MAG: DUF3857 domain-containing protein [Bacteroidota bacterium]